MLELKTQGLKGVKVLNLSGRFVAHTAPQVREWLLNAAQKAPARVIVNLGGVNFLDSQAIGTLVQGMKRCREQGGDLYVCGLQQPVRVIFELMRLDMAFKIFENVEEALDAFQHTESAVDA